jgi:hypothetical protein
VSQIILGVREFMLPTILIWDLGSVLNAVAVASQLRTVSNRIGQVRVLD